MLDEPVNGLDPEGIHWIRNLLKALAAEGRTVFVSSHLMSEMALTADHLIVIGRGRLIADTSVDEFVRRASQKRRARALAAGDASCASSCSAPDVDGRRAPSRGCSRSTGLTAEQIGELAAAHGIVLHELTPQQASLEEAFMELTRDDVEFRPPSAASAARWPRERDAPRSRVPRARADAAASRRRGSSLSEWTKLHSLRSTRWSLLVGDGADDRPAAASFAAVISSHWAQHEPARARRPPPARHRARRRERRAARDRACSACS